MEVLTGERRRRIKTSSGKSNETEQDQDQFLSESPTNSSDGSFHNRCYVFWPVFTIYSCPSSPTYQAPCIYCKVLFPLDSG